MQAVIFPGGKSTMSQLFIGYAEKDRPFVLHLVHDLEYLSKDLMIDFVMIKRDDSIIEKVKQRMDDADFVAAVVSGNCVFLPLFRRDLATMTSQEIFGRPVKVLPILLEGCQVPECLSGKYCADFRAGDFYLHSLAELAQQLNLDFDPSRPPWIPDDSAYFSTLQDAERVRGELYNRLGMKIMEWAGRYYNTPYYKLFPEDWRRADDGATYACDTGNYELYQDSMSDLDRIQARYSDFMHLFTPRGVLLREATRLFSKAAGLGDLEAVWNLGWRYELGEGVGKNHDRAVLLWQRAAHCGHRASAAKLRELGLPVE
jgi:hypothetical protein